MQITFEQIPAVISELFVKVENIEQVLIQQFKESEPVDGKPLNIEEAAKFLSLSVPTIYGLVHRQEIPVYKRPGTKRLYFSKKELEEWIKAGRKKTIKEIQHEVDNYMEQNKH